MSPTIRGWFRRWRRRSPMSVRGRCTDACAEGLALFPDVGIVKVSGIVEDPGSEGIRRFLGTHAWLTLDGAIVDPTAHQYLPECPPARLRYHPFLPGVRMDLRDGNAVACGPCWRPRLLAGDVLLCWCTAGPVGWFRDAIGVDVSGAA